MPTWAWRTASPGGASGALPTGTSDAQPACSNVPADAHAAGTWQQLIRWSGNRTRGELLTDIGTRYPDLPLMVTENGAAFYDQVSADGQVHDADRVSYLHGHINAVGEAIDAGIDVRGYFLWSLLDNFEWSWGYDRRFGIIRVDFDTLERTLKDSAHWYAEAIRTNALPDRDLASR